MGIIVENSDLRVLNTKLESLHTDVHEMRSALRELSSAITKLALVEERLVQTATSLGRAFDAIEKVEVRLNSLEKLGTSTLRTAKWLDRMVWAAAAAAVIFVAKQTKLI